MTRFMTSLYHSLRASLSAALFLTVLGGCTLPKAVEEYDDKECEEIRKLAQEQFLARTPESNTRFKDDDNVNSILGTLFQDDERVERQAKRISYDRRCR